MVSLGLAVPRALLLERGAAAAAAALGGGVRWALGLMASDLEAFADRMYEGLARPGRLFDWNSWIRVGRTLRRAGFSADPAREPVHFEWLNARCARARARA